MELKEQYCRRCTFPFTPKDAEADAFHCEDCTDDAKSMTCPKCMKSWWIFEESPRFLWVDSDFFHPCDDCIKTIMCKTCPEPDPNDMNILICDHCGLEGKCLPCAGLTKVPKGKWYCSPACVRIVLAKRPREEEPEDRMQRYRRVDAKIAAYQEQRAVMDTIQEELDMILQKGASLREEKDRFASELMRSLDEETKAKNSYEALHDELKAVSQEEFLNDETNVMREKLRHHDSTRKLMRTYRENSKVLWDQIRELGQNQLALHAAYVEPKRQYDIADREAYRIYEEL